MRTLEATFTPDRAERSRRVALVYGCAQDIFAAEGARQANEGLAEAFRKTARQVAADVARGNTAHYHAQAAGREDGPEQLVVRTR